MKDTLPKKRFSLTRPQCAQCVQLQEEVKRLRAENHRLKVPRRRDYQQRQIDESYFGSSTPSAKKKSRRRDGELQSRSGRTRPRSQSKALSNSIFPKLVIKFRQ